MDQNSSPPRINLQRAACTFAGLGTLLFLAAGTMRWAGGWAFLAEITIGGLITEAWLARHDPGLLAERRTARGQAGWDRVITSIMPLLWLTWLPLMALDAVRYQTSLVPVWLQCAGAAMIAAVAIDAHPDMRACAEQWVTPHLSAPQSPDATLAKRYASIFPTYLDARLASRPVWKQLAALRAGDDHV